MRMMPSNALSRFAARLGGGTRNDRFGALAGGSLLVALVIADVGLGEEVALTGAMIVVPFAAALWAGTALTAAVAALTFLCGAASGLWNDDFGATGYDVRIALLVAGGTLAVASAWARERGRHGAGRLELLNEVGAVADGSLPLGETLDRVLAVIVPAVADICMVDAIHDQRVLRSAVRVRGRRGGGDRETEQRLSGRAPSLPEWLTASGAPFPRHPRFIPRFNDEDVRRIAHGEEDLAWLRSLELRSSITVPMLARDRMLGALTLNTAWSGRTYSMDDVRFAQVLAGRVALALDNAGLFSDLESVERRMDNVMSLLDEAVVIHDAEGELVFANPAAGRMLDLPEAEDRAGAESIGERLGIQAENGSPLGPGDLLGLKALEGAATAPLVARVDRHDGGPERWLITRAKPILGPEGRALYAVTAIEDVTAVKRAEFGQRLLARAGELLSASTDYRRMLRGLPDVAVPELADWCSVYVLAGDGAPEQLAVSHVDPEGRDALIELRRRHPLPVGGEGRIGEAFRKGESILAVGHGDVVPGVPDDPSSRQLVEAVAARSGMLVPITFDDRTLGVLTFGRGPRGREFDREDLALATEIARRAGTAIENARLAAERSEVAHVLQEGLKPPALPHMQGWESAAMYQPAGEVNAVGGDFYDAFEIDGGWMLTVGDVVGRGAAAASLTALARHTIRTAGILTGDPCRALELLDDALRARGEGALCTAAILVLPSTDADPAAVTLVAGGHPLPLLLRDGEVAEVGRPGPLLGAFKDSAWERQALELRSGDGLVLYTDGVIEARGASERFGDTRLRAELAGATSPLAAIGRVGRALEDFLGGEPDDDVAVIAVRRQRIAHARSGQVSVADDLAVARRDPA